MRPVLRRLDIIQIAGITLIALIITIIVMLILAGVTINAVVNGGLFGQAQNAVEKTKKAAEEEQAEIDKAIGKINDLGGEYAGGYYSATKGVNTPKITDGMIPVKYVGENWVVCKTSDASWYNYVDQASGVDGTSYWANVMLMDGIETENKTNAEIKGMTREQLEGLAGEKITTIRKYVCMDTKICICNNKWIS